MSAFHSRDAAEIILSHIAEDDPEGGGIEITAHVRIPGIYDGPTTWWACVDEINGGGLVPSGDSIDCWVDQSLCHHIGSEDLVAIGLEVTALAGAQS